MWLSLPQDPAETRSMNKAEKGLEKLTEDRCISG